MLYPRNCVLGKFPCYESSGWFEITYVCTQVLSTEHIHSEWDNPRDPWRPWHTTYCLCTQPSAGGILPVPGSIPVGFPLVRKFKPKSSTALEGLYHPSCSPIPHRSYYPGMANHSMPIRESISYHWQPKTIMVQVQPFLAQCPAGFSVSRAACTELSILPCWASFQTWGSFFFFIIS